MLVKTDGKLVLSNWIQQILKLKIIVIFNVNKKALQWIKTAKYIKKNIEIFFRFFRKQHTASRQNQVCSKLHVSKANFQSRISTDFEHYTPPQTRTISWAWSNFLNKKIYCFFSQFLQDSLIFCELRAVLSTKLKLCYILYTFIYYFHDFPSILRFYFVYFCSDVKKKQIFLTLFRKS